MPYSASFSGTALILRKYMTFYISKVCFPEELFSFKKSIYKRRGIVVQWDHIKKWSCR